MLALAQLLSAKLSFEQGLEQIEQYWQLPEQQLVPAMLAAIQWRAEDALAVMQQAKPFAQQARLEPEVNLLTQLLQQFPLSSQSGRLLMTLAEALPRTPGRASQQALLQSLLAELPEQELLQLTQLTQHWSQRGLSLLHRIQRPSAPLGQRWLKPLGLQATRWTLDWLAKDFVLGQNMAKAMARAKSWQQQGYALSYDLLGEAAITQSESHAYLLAYQQAIAKLAGQPNAQLSLKLSALHPRYRPGQETRLQQELLPVLLELLVQAKQVGVGITLDAEELHALPLQLHLLAQLYRHPHCRGYQGLGLALQSYHKGCLPALLAVKALAQEHPEGLQLRLVKGAYWDAEIKAAQQQGLAQYPVFTRKEQTDLCYLLAAQWLSKQKGQAQPSLRPAFGSHNALTLAACQHLMRQFKGDWELQRLHGMGEAMLAPYHQHTQVRIYAPVGQHQQLLPYLVRRILENGANNSFILQLANPQIPLTKLLACPVNAVRQRVQQGLALMHPAIPLPSDLFRPRRNSLGLALDWPNTRAQLQARMQTWFEQQWRASALLALSPPAEEATVAAEPLPNWQARHCPANPEQLLGMVAETDPKLVPAVMQAAQQAQPHWAGQSNRSQWLLRLADHLQAEPWMWLTLLQQEAGKTLKDAQDELREAIDFLRYYAQQAELLQPGKTLPGPFAEHNHLSYRPKGLWLCISPWNFPLAIFVGQIAAALVMGNVVVAKPAEQCSIIAYQLVFRWRQLGLPHAVLQLVLGRGERLGPELLTAPELAGVAFTGSFATAKLIERQLAARNGPILPLVAETGGQNVMLADNSAQPDQLLRDVLHSAFGSAGQRCSALRLLCLPNQLYDHWLPRLQQAAAELRLGDPRHFSTDLGPVIDRESQEQLLSYLQQRQASTFVWQSDQQVSKGWFVPPSIVRLHSLADLQEERFGPILHILPYALEQLPELLQQIRLLGYGLTLGVQSRDPSFIRLVSQQLPVGNLYVNRTMTGAVVGSQPFGGHGYSGTGPKAGGPHYLLRFVNEHCQSINLAALGGSLDLLTLKDD